MFVMRADNRGKGGIMALTALVTPRRRARPGGGDLEDGDVPREALPPARPENISRRRNVLILLGLFGAALLYGDSMITPAISVLSAIEGLEVATPFFRPYIIPITIGILVGLFPIQQRGTAGIGKVFGPVTLVWFLTLVTLGVSQVVQNPEVLVALNPLEGASFFARNGLRGFLVLGSVFLVVTGGEALYADVGHFGIRPIRLRSPPTAWSNSAPRSRSGAAVRHHSAARVKTAATRSSRHRSSSAGIRSSSVSA